MSETIYAKGEGGVVWEFDLPLSEPFADQLAKGTLVRCNEDGSPLVAEAPGDDPADNSPEPEKDPLDSANKAELQEAAKERGLDTDGTKAEILARIREHDEAAKSDDPTNGQE